MPLHEYEIRRVSRYGCGYLAAELMDCYPEWQYLGLFHSDDAALRAVAKIQAECDERAERLRALYEKRGAGFSGADGDIESGAPVLAECLFRLGEGPDDPDTRVKG